jgi:hypothetical protein
MRDCCLRKGIFILYLYTVLDISMGYLEKMMEYNGFTSLRALFNIFSRSFFLVVIPPSAPP